MENNFDLTLDIPDGIREMKQSEVVAWLAENGRTKGTASFSPIAISRILNNIFSRLGLILDNEQMLFLLDDSKRLLCEASAGSGKTTVSQLKMIKFKMLYGISGDDILSIAYNDHAAADMLNRHNVLIEQIMAQKIAGVKLDSKIRCRTFHSNALAWVIEYKRDCGIEDVNNVIVSEKNETKFMDNAIKNSLKKVFGDKADEVIKKLSPSARPALLAFNSYIEERMLSVAEAVDTPRFKEIGLDANVVEMCINRFNQYCELNHMYTFSGILVKFYNLLKNNTEARVRVQNAYKIVLVDEYQDMSPLMNEIISLMIGENTIFNAIGDGDQSIYSFKGTDSLNCIKFKQYFNNGIVVSMGANRRCRKNIVNAASNILSINNLRYKKELYSIKDGGTISSIGYDTREEEFSRLIQELKSVPTKELHNICVAYRNKDSSHLLAKMLLNAGIPSVVRSGYDPYKDLLSSSLFEIFIMLRQPINYAYHKIALFKLIPAKREDVEKLVDAKQKSGESCHYIDYDWDSLGKVSYEVKKILVMLRELEGAVKSDTPMSNYFNKVFYLFQKYYWNYVRELVKFPPELESSIVSDYSTSLSYKKFYEKYMDTIGIRDRFIATGNGVRLTTFHGLKGLEFDKVYLVDLDDDIFPNYSIIEKECNGNLDAVIEEKEECARLFYVACTRPRDELILMYSNKNPSIYVDLVMKGTLTEKVDKCDSDDDSIMSDFDELFEFDADENVTDDTTDSSIEDFIVPEDTTEKIVIDSNIVDDSETSDVNLKFSEIVREEIDESEAWARFEEMQRELQSSKDKQEKKNERKGAIGIIDFLSS